MNLADDFAEWIVGYLTGYRPHIRWTAERSWNKDEVVIRGRYRSYESTYHISGLTIAQTGIDQFGVIAKIAANSIESWFKDAMGENYRPTRDERKATFRQETQGIHPGQDSGVRETGRTLMELLDG